MKKHIKTFLWVALIVFIGFRLRLIGIEKPSGIWFDEMIVYNQAISPFPLGVIKSAVVFDILMPLYQLLLAIWIKIFGNDDLTLRMFSAITGSLAIIGIYLSGARAKDNKTGYVAAILFALNGCAIYFSQEIKFYILAMFFCAFNLYFFLRLLENQKDKIGWAGLITTCVLGCYTFQIYIFLAFVQFCYLLYENIKKNEDFKHYFVSSTITAVLLTPFIILNILISSNMKNSYAPSTLFLNIDASSFFNFFQNWLTPFALNKADNYLHYFDSFIYVYNLADAIAIFVIMTLMVIFIIHGLFKNEKARKLGIVGLLFFVLTFVAGIFLNFCFTVRYGVLIVPFLVILAAIGICEINKKTLRDSILTLFVISLLFINVFSSSAAAKANRAGLKPIADIMKEFEFGEKDIVFLAFSKTDLFDKYYKYDGMIINAPVIYNDVVNKSFGIKKTGDIKNDFRDYLKSDEPTKGEKSFFKLNINTKKHKGGHIMFVKGASDDYDIKKIASNDELYATQSFYFLPPYKFVNNMIQLCEENFGPGKLKVTKNLHIFIYDIK